MVIVVMAGGLPWFDAATVYRMGCGESKDGVPEISQSTGLKLRPVFCVKSGVMLHELSAPGCSHEGSGWSLQTEGWRQGGIMLTP